MTQPRHHTRELDSDLHTFEQTLLRHTSDGMDCATNVISSIVEYCDGDERMKAETIALMAEFVKMEAEIKQHAEALRHVKSVAGSLEEGETLKTQFEEKLGQLKKKKPPNVSKHPKYVALMKEAEKGGSSSLEEELEQLRAQLLGETDDDEVAMTDTEVNIKCPYTGQNMTDPVRNTVCRHVYDREGILGHIRVKKKKAKCPVGGCVNPEAITVSQLEEFREMKRYINLLNQIG